MTPLVLGLGVPELLIILAVVLLLFGGARLAGLGKSTGRALREFKEETKGLRSDESQQQPPLNPGPGAAAPTSTEYQPPSQANTSAQPPSGATYQQPPRANQDSSGSDLRNDA
ncbi:MAG TPA: twin-arginine translocase TatA/TatE family subunit [Propionibacteriaceae bacterium]|jgi:sec-independent protein translocase protein TatA|nr:twin-arginine translocase TatA/TatE family subunit [Propionibacteriaceae bacterium]